MGGRGSGRRFRWDSKATVGECLSLDVRTLQRQGALRPWSETLWVWKDDEGKAISKVTIKGFPNHILLTYAMRKNGDDSESLAYKVLFEWTNCNYGGRRQWVKCPGTACGRRVAILYLGGKYFLCRKCQNLGYQSQREDRAGRLRWKAQQIRRRLGGSMNLLEPFPPRPKYMHRVKYWLLDMKADHWGNKSLEMSLAKITGEKA